tara:strand:- start:48 stop:578 length:531 start_codon:yes stop_codon:yes gene_type:complete
VSYKPPKYLYFYLLILIFGITLSYFSYTQLNVRDLGIYNISNTSDTKLNLDIKNVNKLTLEIKNIHQNQDKSLCKSDDIYVYGTLRNRINNDIVRIRIQNIEVTNQLKIISKSSTIEPTRNYVHTPIDVISENFDCIDEVITIFFEEEVNVSYLLVKNTDKYKSYNKIKTFNIKAY